jgi:hypothetical protein
MAGTAHDWDSPTKRWLQPFPVLMVIYFGYFAIVYSGFWRYTYQELMSLSTNIMGFQPTFGTVALYVFGAVVMVLGFMLGVALARRRDRRPGPLATVTAAIGSARGRLRPLLRSRTLWFWLGIAGWLVGFAAVAVQWVASGGASLTDIGTRWYQSPVIVFIAMSQIFFVPVLVVTAERPWQRWVTGLLFVLSIVGLSALGARNIPAKAVVATFLALVYVVGPKILGRIALALGLVLVIAMGVVGALSKSGIYATPASAKLAVALTYSDSVGSVYNLDRIVRMTPTAGAYGGNLLRDSILAGVPRQIFPGAKPDYANYQIGKYLGGRQNFVIGGQVINRGVSLAATLLGPAYADLGLPGVIAQMLLVGLMIGYLQVRSKSWLWLVPFLASLGSYVINGVNVGLFSPPFLAAIALTVVVIVVDLLFGRSIAVEPIRSV